MEADGPYSHPAALDTDVAGLDVAPGDPRLRLAPGAFRAEVVGLEFHSRLMPGSCPVSSTAGVSSSDAILCSLVLTGSFERYTIAHMF